jgi:hypothetical protein
MDVTPEEVRSNVRPYVPKNLVCRKIERISNFINRYINRNSVINLFLILNIKVFVVVGFKEDVVGKIRDPCNLIGRFRHTGFFATQGRTLGKQGKENAVRLTGERFWQIIVLGARLL